jgi:hypothetical protein
MPKQQSSALPEAVNQGKHDFELVSLQAPNLHTTYYQGSTDGKVVGKGYREYVSDYLFYTETLRRIKLNAKIASKEAVVIQGPVSIKTATIKIRGAGPYSEVGVSDDPANSLKKRQVNKPIVSGFPVDKRALVTDGVEGPDVWVSGVIGDYASGDHQIPWGAGFVTMNVAFQGGASDVQYAPKKKGPATTPKKVRSAEEVAERAKKEEARKQKKAWFDEKSLALSKGKLEEKLAKSLTTRALAISKADSTVEVTADLDNWRVVTRKGTIKERVKQTSTVNGVKTLKTYTCPKDS